MSKRHFSALLIATILVAVAVTLLVPGRTGKEDAYVAGLLLPEVGQRINEVEQVRITLAGNEPAATLRRGEGQWRIAELSGYPADWTELRDLLRDLAQAEIIEYKTGNPAYYHRLGVEDISSPDAAGILLEIFLDGESLGLIIGNEASGREGQYVRPAGTERSILIDRVLDIPTDLVDWTEREFMDVGSYQVKEVEIIQPDGDHVLVRKAAATDTDFELQDIPEDREPLSSWAVNALANVLSGLRMDSVKPDSGGDRSGAARIRLLSFSGVEYMGEAWSEEDKYWFRVLASVPGGPFLPEGDEAAQEKAAENQEQAAAVNARTAGWVFEITESKFAAMTKRFDDLLKPLEEAEAAGP
jgi:hypothetical protein